MIRLHFWCRLCLSPGATVLTVIATDNDAGNNGSVSYSLKQVPMRDNDPLFSIDPHTGLVTTLQSNALDRELQPEYQIIVQAKDRGSPAMSCEHFRDDYEFCSVLDSFSVNMFFMLKLTLNWVDGTWLPTDACVLILFRLQGRCIIITLEMFSSIINIIVLNYK